MSAPSPAVQRLGHAVVLQGAALAEVLHLVTLGARERSRRDAIAPSPRLTELIATLAEAVSTGSSRHDAMTHGPGREDLVTVVEQQLSTTEAARLLGLSIRHTQRLGPSIGARRVGRGYVYDRTAVVAYREARREQER